MDKTFFAGIADRQTDRKTLRQLYRYRWKRYLARKSDQISWKFIIYISFKINNTANVTILQSLKLKNSLFWKYVTLRRSFVFLTVQIVLKRRCIASYREMQWKISTVHRRVTNSQPQSRCHSYITDTKGLVILFHNNILNDPNVRKIFGWYPGATLLDAHCKDCSSIVPYARGKYLEAIERALEMMSTRDRSRRNVEEFCES